MVVLESDMMSHEEIESPLRHDQLTKINPFSSLPRQSSIYSLTLDEFQHTICESGRNFGSMNMDEFLNNIWTAEENQVHAHTQPHITSNSNNNNDYNGAQLFPLEGSANNKPIAKQLSLSRQGSLTLPAPLCRKTVDEVWSEIHRTREQQSNNGGGGGGGGGSSTGNKVQNQGSTQREPTFGEMTLEDFLVKAGVVREQQCNLSPPPQPPSYGMFPNPSFGPGFGPRPVVGNIPPYQPLGQQQQIVAEQTTYNGKRNGGYQTGPPPPVSAIGGYSGRVSGGGGYGLGGSPVSPQSDGMGGGDGNQYGTMDMSGMRGGRKRIIDGPVEKVVERRQRRMIKNRESAARSRARKQAYTVELEAELNQLKDENAQLKHALAELEAKRKQQFFEAASMKAQTKAQKTKERIRMMRRSFSGPV